jgi:hypothetical protein
MQVLYPYPQAFALASQACSFIIPGAKNADFSRAEPGQPDPALPIAGVAQLVEHNVANVVVVGSNPITRSFKGC